MPRSSPPGSYPTNPPPLFPELAERLLRAFLPAVLLVLGACSSLYPPDLPWWYVNVNPDVTFHRIEAAGESSSGPYPGIELQIGRYMLLNKNSVTAFEIGGKATHLELGGEVSGSAYGGFGGVRNIWFPDRPLRFDVNGGIGWYEYSFANAPNDFDFRGPDGYVGGAVEYFLTPRFSLGAKSQFHVFYANGNKINDVNTYVDVGLMMTYRF